MNTFGRALLICAFALRVVFAQCIGPNALAHELNVIDIHSKPIIEALALIGRQEHVCFGIGVTDARLLEPAPDIHLEHAHVYDVLRTVLSGTGYAIAQFGSVVVLRRPARHDTVLDLRIGRFEAHGATVQEASTKLAMTVHAKEQKISGGTLGTFAPGCLTDRVQALSVRSKTAAQLLSLLLSHSTMGGIWLAWDAPLRSERALTEPWIILEYDHGCAPPADLTGYILAVIK